MQTPFHIEWKPAKAAEKQSAPSEEQAKFQRLLRELFQFDCADLDFGIYRIMNYKRRVLDRYIERELPEAIEAAVGQGAIHTEAERAKVFAEVRQTAMQAFGDDAFAPGGKLIKYQETPLGEKYILWRKRACHSLLAADVRRDVYNHLYAFFGRYYQDGDFMPKRRYAWEHPYVVPYSGEDVHFHWANRDQYYVKAAEHFSDYRYRTASGVSVRFFMCSAKVDQNDVKGQKRFFFPILDRTTWNGESRVLELPFECRSLTPAEAKEYGRNGQQKAIINRAESKIPVALAAYPEAAAVLLGHRQGGADDSAVSPTYFTYHGLRFARRRTSDFFVHRDLEGFLTRELEYYLKSEVLSLGSLTAGGEAQADAWLDKMRVIRRVGRNIIEFLAQIEGFQKMLWEKRKFVIDVQYCVAVGLVPKRLLPLVLQCEAQWDEWCALGCVQNDASLFTSGDRMAARRAFMERNPGVLLDTRHFDSSFLDELLATLVDIDDKTDGVAIKSENWQALNLLQERYRKSLQMTYIDPPYNTKSSEIAYKNSYKHSTWLTLMGNRISLARSLMSSEAVVVIAIDEVEQEVLGQLLSHLYPDQRKTCVTVVHNATGQQGSNFSYTHEFAYFVFPKVGSFIGLQTRLKPDIRPLRDVSKGAHLRTDAANCFYPIYVQHGQIVGFGDVCDDEYHPTAKNVKTDDGTIEIYPIDARNQERKWVFARKNVERIKDELSARLDRKTGFWDIVRSKSRFNYKTVWSNKRYSANSHGTVLLRNLLPNTSFAFPKSIFTVRDSIDAALGNSRDGCVVDYFAGSGTTGHAVINLNREDGGRRNFILVEMGDHFDSVLLPRLKKVAFSPEWKKGVAIRSATPEEARRGPRIIKYFCLETYEDALGNIEFGEEEGDLFDLQDYMLRYMLKWETRGCATLLNVTALERPFAYKLRLNGGGEDTEILVDLPETFNYLLGLAVRTRQVYDKEGRRYVTYTGTMQDGRTAVVIWRNTEGWTLEDRERDAKFVAAKRMTSGADEIYMNGDSMVKDARSLDILFKRRMFGSASN